MKISPVAFMANPQKINKPESELNDIKKELENNGVKIPKFTPVQNGLINAGFWFGFGFLVDRLLGKMFKNLKTPMKLSLLINGMIGLIAGGLTFIKASKENMVPDKQ